MGPAAGRRRFRTASGATRGLSYGAHFETQLASLVAPIGQMTTAFLSVGGEPPFEMISLSPEAMSRGANGHANQTFRTISPPHGGQSLGGSCGGDWRSRLGATKQRFRSNQDGFHIPQAGSRH